MNPAVFRLGRPAVRQLTARRFTSTTTSTAASQTNQTAAKAQEVTKAAVNRAAALANGMLNTLGKMGGRTGRMVQTVQSLIPPTIYYSKVGLEVAKLVFHGQKMAPPTGAAFKESLEIVRKPVFWTDIMSNVSSVVYTAVTQPTTIIPRMKSQASFFLVLGAETLGFFTIGEIIGRRKLIGYSAEKTSAH